MDGQQLRALKPELDRFLDRYAPLFGRDENQTHARRFVQGLLHKGERRNIENIAEALDGGPVRTLQAFVTTGVWHDQTLLAELRRDVLAVLADEDAVWNSDETGFPKKGTKSVGVKRQYSGTLGRTDNCQIGVFANYCSPKGHTFMDRRFFLPEEWAKDAGRRAEAGVPEDVLFRTKPALALEMVAQAVADGPIGPIMGSIHPDDRERVGELVARAVESGGRYEADYRVDRGDGSSRWVTARGQVERDAQGRALRFPGVVIDVTDRKRAEETLARVTEELERRKRLYETALPNTPDLVYVFDLTHRFSYANEALLTMWGKTWDEAIGRTCLELGYEPWHASKHDEEIEQVIATKRPIRGEVPFTGTNGRRIYDYIFVPVLGTDGEVEAIAGTTRDITDRQALEQELRDTDRKKDDFIALLAHELRNPLAPIRNGLQVIRLAGGNPAALAEARQMMDRQLTHMVRLIDDLLDISRINRSKMELRRTRVALSEVVASAVETARPLIDEAGHELSVSLPAAPVYLDADLTRLAQVFSNLLTNSAKYTPSGGRVWLSGERKGGHIEVSVRDTGIGIPAESLGNIFDMFSQVDRTVERSTGGLGIGLALVKGLVEMHAGTVTAASPGEDGGSIFTVTLPVLAGKVEHTASQVERTRGPSRLVLVVDDNRDGADSLAMTLRLLGDEVRTAYDGAEAVAAAEQFRPEVILMDVGMPRLSGLDATRRIRAEEWGRTLTIIALTGWGQENDRARSREAGCDGHLVKPVNLQDLEKLLTEVRK